MVQKMNHASQVEPNSQVLAKKSKNYCPKDIMVPSANQGSPQPCWLGLAFMFKLLLLLLKLDKLNSQNFHQLFPCVMCKPTILKPMGNDMIRDYEEVR